MHIHTENLTSIRKNNPGSLLKIQLIEFAFLACTSADSNTDIQQFTVGRHLVVVLNFIITPREMNFLLTFLSCVLGGIRTAWRIENHFF